MLFLRTIILLLLCTPIVPGAPLRILCLGDSITQGLTLAGSNGGYSWRYPLWRSMIQAGYDVDFIGSIDYVHGSPQIIPPPVNGIAFDRNHEGHSAWRADHILNSRSDALPGVGGTGSGRLSQWLTTYTPNIAVIMIGTNDCLSRENGNTTTAEILAITRTIQADSPSVSILLCSLPNTSVPHAQLPLAQLNANLAANAESWSTSASRVKFVNCTSGYHGALFNHDGLHPNATGERFLASRIFEEFQEIVGPPNFSAWIAEYPEIPANLRAPDDDPDRDGFTNFQHFIFGGSPATGNDARAPLKLLSQDSSGQVFSVYRRRHTSLQIHFTTSSDLSEWTPAPLTITNRQRDGFYDEITFRTPNPEGPLPRSSYWRIEVND